MKRYRIFMALFLTAGVAGSNIFAQSKKEKPARDTTREAGDGHSGLAGHGSDGEKGSKRIEVKSNPDKKIRSSEELRHKEEENKAGKKEERTDKNQTLVRQTSGKPLEKPREKKETKRERIQSSLEKESARYPVERKAGLRNKDNGSFKENHGR